MDDSRTIASSDQLWGQAVVLNLKWVRQGTFQASVDIEIPRIGLSFFFCKWFRKADGTDWIKLPQESWVDSNGVRHYIDLHKMRSGPYQAFQASAVEAIRAYVTEVQQPRPEANEPF
jgi:hypothetical protein